MTIGGVEYNLVGWLSSSKNPKAPTINLKVGLTKGTAGFMPVKKVEVDDDVPF